MQTYYAKTLYDLVKQYIPDGIYIYHCTTNEEDIVLNNMLSSNEETLTNNEYITITEEDIQEQQDETVIEENSTMKSLLKIAITESLNNNGLTS